MPTARKHGSRPVVFLSVAVPRERDAHDWDKTTPSPLPSGDDRDSFLEDARALHQRCCDEVDADVVQRASEALVRGLLDRGWGLVCGDRQLAPTLIAQLPSPPVEDDAREPPSLVFVGPETSVDPEARAGPEARAPALEDRRDVLLSTIAGFEDPSASLTATRKAMVREPNLRAAFFVGGARGSFEEAALFRYYNPGVPMFALAATAGASRRLLEGEPLIAHIRDSSEWSRLSGASAEVRTFLTRGDPDAFTGAVQGHAGMPTDALRSGDDYDTLIEQALTLAAAIEPRVDPDFVDLQAWHCGDTVAGNRLFAKYWKVLERFFRSKAPKDHSDLVQITLEKLIRTSERFEGRCTFRSHLFRIARRTLADYCRARRPDYDELTHSVQDVDGLSPSSAVAKAKRHQVLIDCINALPVASRELLELYYWQGLTSKELAEVFKVAPETIRYRVRVIRTKLRESYLSANIGDGLPSDLSLGDQVREVIEFLVNGPEHEPTLD